MRQVCVGGLLLNQLKQFGGSNKQKISYSPGTLESGKVADRWMVPDDGGICNANRESWR